MSRILVAEKFVWPHYPGLRAGRVYAGKSDITQHPDAETHVVDGPDATETRCGRPRSGFPHEFGEGTTHGKHEYDCGACVPTEI
ncbi:hypothetical protein [Pseudonocardia alni]|uniref:Uncharacterized protein n=1 Tax=Pseudonocardia alni TaxID=33907 RepID=A0A852W5X1_PSEA5|nr:hypothetical protein [Pseudonocardia antarctica]NYG00882.1 hypothetical protein [Pseudonocardia antarctica]